MKQINHLLALRLRQCYRILSEIGFLLAIVAVFAIAGAGLQALENAFSMDALISIPACVLIVLSIDLYRQDKSFLMTIFNTRTKLSTYLSIEYTLLTLPITIYQIINQEYIIAFLILILIQIYSLVSTYLVKAPLSGYKKPILYIPTSIFELKFFIEKQKIACFVVLTLLFLGSIHISLWVLGIALLMGMIPEIFAYKEPIEMTKFQDGFINKKIGSYLLIFTSILFIPTFLTWLTSGMSIWIFLYGIVAILVALTISISIKYEHYYGLRSKVPSKTSTSIIIFLMLLPGFIIVTLGYAIMKYIKANKQIKNLCSS